MIVIRVLAYFVYYLLDAVMIAMFLRAILSWFPLREGNPIVGFLHLVTEPFILPIRSLFYKMNWFQRTPIDVAYMATYLVLILAVSLLQMLF